MNVDAILKNLAALFAGLLVAILFIQSGVDKVVDWNGNLAFLKSHFSKSFLAPLVLPMLAAVTVMELATGFLSAAGIIYFLTGGTLTLTWFPRDEEGSKGSRVKYRALIE